MASFYGKTNPDVPNPGFPQQPPVSSVVYTNWDGKINRYADTPAMMEANGEIMPQFAITQPLVLSNTYFDKISLPFKAIGYEISFER